jgi:hypothetical protein
MIDLDFVTRRTLRARSRLKLNRLNWAQTFWIENDIDYNICKNNKNSWNGYREFKILLQEKEFFNVDFLIHCELLKIMRDNLTSTSVKVVPLVVTSMRKKKFSKIIAVWPSYSSKTGDRQLGWSALYVSALNRALETIYCSLPSLVPVPDYMPAR